jgi:hypothetical protein
VFDTVGSLGIPGKLNWIARRQFSFHDTQLSKCIENCFHAVSIDEKRMTFLATMWEEPFNLDGALPNVQQVWFPGVHGDIGGGYTEDALSKLTLDWMVGRLKSLGVAFEKDRPDLRPPHGASALGAIHESRKLPLYLPSRIAPRYRPINGIVAQDGARRGSDIVQYRPIAEFVHRSALDRWQADSAYRPINLGAVLPMIKYDDLKVIDTTGGVMNPESVRTQFGEILI